MLVGCHEPPTAVGISRSFSARAMAQTRQGPLPGVRELSSQSLGSRVCGLLACQSIVYPAALAGRKQTLPRQHPHHGRVTPATAAGGRYSSSVQLIRQRTARNEASRQKLSNSRHRARAWESAARLFADAPGCLSHRIGLRLAGTGSVLAEGFPIAGSRLKRTCDKAESATLRGARPPPGSLCARPPWIESGSAFRRMSARGNRLAVFYRGSNTFSRQSVTWRPLLVGMAVCGQVPRSGMSL